MMDGMLDGGESHHWSGSFVPGIYSLQLYLQCIKRVTQLTLSVLGVQP